MGLPASQLPGGLRPQVQALYAHIPHPGKSHGRGSASGPDPPRACLQPLLSRPQGAQGRGLPKSMQLRRPGSQSLGLDGGSRRRAGGRAEPGQPKGGCRSIRGPVPSHCVCGNRSHSGESSPRQQLCPHAAPPHLLHICGGACCRTLWAALPSPGWWGGSPGCLGRW